MRRQLKYPLRSLGTKTHLSLAALCLSIIAVGYVSTPFVIQTSVGLYEDISFALHPSAELAYRYGERHFDGQDVHNYDIGRAAKYFRKAAALDPSLLYVHHQLARIAFLHGDFGTAMAQIDTQIALHGKETPNSYYVRGLIEGYMGDYASAAEDYEEFLKVDPHNWAAVNDYAWVLLKDNRPQEAADATEKALVFFPENPWLLNSSAIALYEIGDIEKAHERVQKAWDHVQKVNEEEWLHSYPGNDPAIAGEGISTFRGAVSENMHRIELALAASAVQ
ncbi:MAG TPA: tetratricopeptide repeat protein [Candidatus Paceibacterota bacterium]